MEYNTLYIERMEEALYNSWSLESSSKWSKDNPAMGQCGVSTVSDISGGEIRKTNFPNEWHFYNFINGKRYDFTVSQFREYIVYMDMPSNRAERKSSI